MNHTKGPWDASQGIVKVGDGLPYIPIFAHLKGGGDPLVAICYSGVPDGEDGMTDNARLVAAAPDLLKACKAMGSANTPGTIDEAFGLIRTAIARAEGRTA